VRVLDVAAPADLPPGVEVVLGSVTDRALVEAALRGAGTVYHLAALPDLWAPRKEDFDAVNLGGTRTVLEAAAEAGVRRIVYTSTESILKSARRDDPPALGEAFDRLTADDMPGTYCRSKFLADRAATALAQAGAPVVIVHPTMPIGPGDRRLTPPTRMILGYLNGDYPLYLDCAFNLVDARDAAVAHIAAAEHGRPGERFMAGGHDIRLSDLLGLLHRLTGLPMPRRRIPYPVALAAATVSELWADLVTRRPPAATVAGVRLVRTPLTFDAIDAAAVPAPRRPLAETLADAIADLAARGLLSRPLKAA
jgi:dihydroflavonol-4-reductase